MKGEVPKPAVAVWLRTATAVEFEFAFDKFLAVLHYFAVRKVPALDKYKICKLLFLADKYHVVRYGRPIIGDRYCALQYGPIPSRALDLLNAFIRTEDESESGQELMKMNEVVVLDRGFQHPRFSARRTMTSDELDNLSKSDIEALEHVIEEFGNRGFYELKSLTHSVFAYKKAVDDLSDMRYEDFFEEDADAIEGALEKMLEDDAIRRAFHAK